MTLSAKIPVSVIIVVKNGEKYLADALESVIHQTCLPQEILVIDGNSTDQTAQIAKSYTGVTYLLQTEPGLANARNMGIRNASGELVAFLDHDDYWPRNKLEVQVGHFTSFPEIQYSYGMIRLFLEEGHQLRRGYNLKLLDEELVGRTPGTLMARKSLFDHIGMFNPVFSIACDVDWFKRAEDYEIKSFFLPQLLLNKRLHSLNLSGDANTNRRELFSVIRESLERTQRLKKNFRE